MKSANLRDLAVSLTRSRLEQQAVVREGRFGPRPLVSVDRKLISAGEWIVKEQKVHVRAGQMRD